MSLFGHHHAGAPTALSRVAEAAVALAHWPLAVWLTIIPIAGGLAIAYVTHRLNVSRDRLALHREDERRRTDDERAAMRVRADLALRLGRHREALRALLAGGNLARLEAEHFALVRRAAKTDVIDVLGQRYLPFMAVLQRQEAALARLGADDSQPLGETERAALAGLDRSFEPYRELFALPDPSLVRPA